MPFPQYLWLFEPPVLAIRSADQLHMWKLVHRFSDCRVVFRSKFAEQVTRLRRLEIEEWHGQMSAIAVTFLGLGVWVAPSLVMRAVASGKNLPEQTAQDWPVYGGTGGAGPLFKPFSNQPEKCE